MSGSTDDKMYDIARAFSSLDLDPQGYSHEVAVKSISSFYEFISRMHPSNIAEIVYPPQTGWPHITRKTCSAQPQVVKLIRHLPYLANDPCIMDDTVSVNFAEHGHFVDTSSALDPIEDADEALDRMIRAEHERKCALVRERMQRQKVEDQTNLDTEGTNLQQNIISTPAHNEPIAGTDDAEDGSDEEESDSKSDQDSDIELPPHIVTLALASTRYGYNIYLDTIRGVIIWDVKEGDYLPRGGLPLPDAPYRSKAFADPENSWEDQPAHKITTFFEMCKEQFRILNWIPHMEGGKQVWSLMDHQKFDDTHMEKRAQIMKDCGWPGDGEGRGWDRLRAERETEEWQASLSR